MLLDLGAVDYLARTPRFDVVYHLLALPSKKRDRRRKSELRRGCASFAVPTMANAYPR